MPVLDRLILACVAAAIVTFARPALAGAYEDILVAARDDRTAIVVDLIRRGMDVNTTDRSGTTLLMFAAGNGNEPLLDFLLRNNANILIQNKYGDTAMSVAALKGRLAIVRRLAESGAPIATSGWNPLHYAAFGGHADVAKYLIAEHAPLDARAPNGQTALMLAAETGHLDVVRLLVAAGADKAAKDPGGKTALDLALKAGNTDIADVLASEGAEQR